MLEANNKHRHSLTVEYTGEFSKFKVFSLQIERKQ